MALARWIGWLVAGLVVLGALVPAILPATYRVERSTVIEASPERIHERVGDLRRWSRWTSWKDADPSIETDIEVPTGPDARQNWTGNSGSGTLAFRSSDPDRGVEYDMTFDDGRRVARGAIRYAPADGGTRVTWILEGSAGGWFGRYFAAMMDRMVGPMFEDGLARLGTDVESPPPADGADPVTSPDGPGRAR